MEEHSSNVIVYPVGRYGFKKKNYDKILLFQSKVNSISAIDLSYIAGLFDGEGCVNITKRQSRNSCSVRAKVYNSYEPIIVWLNSMIPANVYFHESKTASKGIWEYCLTDYFAEIFLRAVLPFLHVKSKQAKLAIEYLGQKKIGNYDGTAYYDSMKVYNQKGRA